MLKMLSFYFEFCHSTNHKLNIFFVTYYKFDAMIFDFNCFFSCSNILLCGFLKPNIASAAYPRIRISIFVRNLCISNTLYIGSVLFDFGMNKAFAITVWGIVYLSNLVTVKSCLPYYLFFFHVGFVQLWNLDKNTPNTMQQFTWNNETFQFFWQIPINLSRDFVYKRKILLFSSKWGVNSTNTSITP